MADATMTQTGEEIRLERTKEQTDRKCPACGGIMDYDPKTGGISCSYCGCQEEIRPDSCRSGPAPEMDFESAAMADGCEWGAAKKVVICKACGAQSVYDELEIANECPYCGSNQVMEEKGERTLAPGGVIPFALTAKEAAAKFTSWIKKKLFCPRAAKMSARPGAFKGIYLPYWTFDADTVSDYAAEYGIDRRVKTRDGERVETRWYSVRGRYREQIDDELVLASSRYDETLMRKVEPFHTPDNKAYQPEYVAGFIAERYSVGLKEGWERAKQLILRRLEANIEDQVRMENRADHARVKHVEVAYSAVTCKYLLLPVWLSTYRYQDRVYHFMVNGQTGKAGGQIPVSPLRVAIAVLLVLSLFLLCGDYWMYGCITAAATAVLGIICRLKNL